MLDNSLRSLRHQEPLWLQIFNSLVFLCSNNLMGPEESSYELLQIAISSGFLLNMKHLLTIKGPTVEIFAVNILFMALGVEGSKGLEFLSFLLESGVSPNSIDPNENRCSALHRAVTLDSKAAVELLLSFGADPDPKMQDTKGKKIRSPLNYALDWYNDGIIAKMLIDFGANVNTGSVKPLLRAARRRNLALMKQLLEVGADPKLLPAGGLSVMYYAIYRHNLILVDLLIKAGFNLNLSIEKLQDTDLDFMRDEFNPRRARRLLTPVQLAVLQGATDIVKRLIEGGAVIDKFIKTEVLKNMSPYLPFEGILTPLQMSIQQKQDEITKILLDGGAGVDFRHSSTATALQLACGISREEREKTELIEALLAKGADVDALPGEEAGRTAIQAAAESGNRDLLRLLLAKFLDAVSFTIPEEDVGSMSELDRPKPGYPTPLWLALHEGHCYMTQRLIEAGPSKWGTPLEQVTKGRSLSDVSLERFQLLLRFGADVNVFTAEKTLIQLAVSKNDMELVELLTEAGADINASGTGMTALEAAVDDNNTYLGKLLIEAGADANISSTATSALQLAVARNNMELVELLVQEGADINTSALDKTALQTAADLESLELVKYLIDWGADVDAGSLGNLATALQYAAMHGSIEIVKYLVERGASVNEQASPCYEATALGLAVRNGHTEAAIFLIENGASVDKCPTADGATTILQLAAKHGNHEIVTYLVENGAKVNAAPATERGATALRFAAINGNIKMAVFLLENGAHVSAKGAEVDGRTALEGAAEHGRLDMVYLLLENDEEPDTIEERCHNAAEFAEAEHHNVIARILRDYRRPQ
ncbi:hypothetical protein ACKAV7_002178 [Fusarium commune]